MNWLKALFGRTKIIIKLPPEFGALIEAGKAAAVAAEATPQGLVGAHALLADPELTSTPIDDVERATKMIILNGLSIAMLRLGPFAPLIGPALKQLVADVLDRVFTDIEKRFIAKYNIQAPAT